MIILFAGTASLSMGQLSTYVEQKNVFGAGVGFGGGLGGPGIAYDLLPGYSGTVSPGIMITYEHTFTKRFGLGASFSYSSASQSANNIPYTIDSAWATNSGAFSTSSGTFNDKITATYIGFGGRALYHFKGSKRFDPYVGAIVGFTLTSLSSTVTTVKGIYPTHCFYPGLLSGVIAGAKIFFTDNIGMWIEAGYSGAPDYLVNAGIAYKLKKSW